MFGLTDNTAAYGGFKSGAGFGFYRLHRADELIPPRFRLDPPFSEHLQ